MAKSVTDYWQMDKNNLLNTNKWPTVLLTTDIWTNDDWLLNIKCNANDWLVNIQGKANDYYWTFRAKQITDYWTSMAKQMTD